MSNSFPIDKVLNACSVTIEIIYQRREEEINKAQAAIDAYLAMTKENDKRWSLFVEHYCEYKHAGLNIDLRNANKCWSALETEINVLIRYVNSINSFASHGFVNLSVEEMRPIQKIYLKLLKEQNEI